ncbi:MAG: 4Fe-4S single cluster domain-containing protein [Kofleriaceae bacterium]
MIPAVTAQVHAVELASRANGPGVRMVVWLQGCTLACPGCFNPTTHPGGGQATPVAELLAQLAATPPTTGLTLSGGEPMQQPDATRALLAGARALGRSTLVFSGYTVEELLARPDGELLLADLDVLVDGRYLAGQRAGTGLRGSRNQRIHLLSSRHTLAEVEATPTGEIRITASGEVVLTGVAPLRLRP